MFFDGFFAGGLSFDFALNYCGTYSLKWGTWGKVQSFRLVLVAFFHLVTG